MARPVGTQRSDSVSGDNFHFDITGAPLDKSLGIAFGEWNTAVGWAEVDCGERAVGREGIWGANQSARRLILFWHKDESGLMIPFPAPLDVAAVKPFIEAWLKAADYGPQPDQDGSNGKGWRVYNETWTHVADSHYAFVAIEPVWIMYGK